MLDWTSKLKCPISTGFFIHNDLDNAKIVSFIDIIKDVIERYGFRFAKAVIKMTDYANEKKLDVILLLDTLISEKPALTYEQYQQLYREVGLDYKGEKDINKKIKENMFFNALQVKFAYAITCHKSQGGQWDNVFVDIGYFTSDMLDKSFLRWLYTAFTRANKKLYLIMLAV